MPKNKLIYYGVLVIAAAALIWVGAWLTKRIEWILPYAGVIGVILVVIGVGLELRNKRLAAANSGSPPPGQPQS